MIAWCTPICKQISLENSLSRLDTSQWPKTLDYEKLSARVEAMRSEAEEVIAAGTRNSFAQLILNVEKDALDSRTSDSDRCFTVARLNLLVQANKTHCDAIADSVVTG